VTLYEFLGSDRVVTEYLLEGFCDSTSTLKKNDCRMYETVLNSSIYNSKGVKTSERKGDREQPPSKHTISAIVSDILFREITGQKESYFPK